MTGPRSGRYEITAPHHVITTDFIGTTVDTSDAAADSLTAPRSLAPVGPVLPL